MTPPVVGTVQIGKPWWASKKLWLAAIAFAVALYSAITGKDLDPSQIAAHIETTATMLAPILTLILAIAHVDGKERDLAASLLDTAKTLNEAAVPLAPAPADPAKVDPLTGRPV